MAEVSYESTENRSGLRVGDQFKALVHPKKLTKDYKIDFSFKINHVADVQSYLIQIRHELFGDDAFEDVDSSDDN